MTTFNDNSIKDEGKYSIQVETDSECDYSLLLYLVRGLMEEKDCSVTVTNKCENKIYLNREVIG